MFVLTIDKLSSIDSMFIKIWPLQFQANIYPLWFKYVKGPFERYQPLPERIMFSLLSTCKDG